MSVIIYRKPEIRSNLICIGSSIISWEELWAAIKRNKSCNIDKLVAEFPSLPVERLKDFAEFISTIKLQSELTLLHSLSTEIAAFKPKEVQLLLVDENTSSVAVPDELMLFKYIRQVIANGHWLAFQYQKLDWMLIGIDKTREALIEKLKDLVRKKYIMEKFEIYIRRYDPQI